MKSKSDASEFLKFQKTLFAAYDEVIENAARRSGITKQEADVLVFFFNNPEYTLVCDAVRLRGFSREYVSKAVEQLEQSNMIEIAEASDDEHMQRISLTGRGGITGKSISAAQERLFSEMLTGVTPEERFIMRGVLEKIYKNAALRQDKSGQ